jgi:hypothetical protein
MQNLSALLIFEAFFIDFLDTLFTLYRAEIPTAVAFLQRR